MVASLFKVVVLFASIVPILGKPTATDITVAGPPGIVLPPGINPEDVKWHTIDVFDHKNGTIIPEEMEAMLSNNSHLEKRAVLPPYQCPPHFTFM